MAQSWDGLTWSLIIKSMLRAAVAAAEFCLVRTDVRRAGAAIAARHAIDSPRSCWISARGGAPDWRQHRQVARLLQQQ